MTQAERKTLLKKLEKLQKEYRVRLTVVINPANKFANIFKKWIKLNWKIAFIDTK